jgi:prephenate dehydrogenase
MNIRQVTIIGAGLMGGSFALAVRERSLVERVVGCDHEAVLAMARARGAIDAGFRDPLRAIDGSQLVVLATPVGQIMHLLEHLAPHLPPQTLITDVGSTKVEIVQRALAVFGKDAAQRFLAGHPMAGKEHSGIEHAVGGLFQGAVWFLTPFAGQDLKSEPFAAVVRLVEGIGAHVRSMDAAQHDLLCASISHLPQMLATALAAMLADLRDELQEEFGEVADLNAIGGRALRESTRLASSPYSMWRDIAFTNTHNLELVLLRLEQRLGLLRENLRTAALREEFERANRFAAELRRQER